MVKGVLEGYMSLVMDTLRQVPIENASRVVEVIYQAYETGKQVFIVGNGGSASTASHFACDLGKGSVVNGKPRLKVLSLNDNMALLTAYANDVSYEDVFAEQLKNLLDEGDVLIGITGSGNSPNILKALETANEMGAVTVGLLGFGGGKARKLCRVHVTVDEDIYGPVEDIHMFLAHAVSEGFKHLVGKYQQAGRLAAETVALTEVQAVH